MARKVFKLCLVQGFTEAYHHLSEEEKKKLWDSVGQGIDKAGAKMATPYFYSRWANDKYVTFFIMEYPDVEAAIADTTNVEQAGLFRYMVSETLLGYEEVPENMEIRER